MTEFKEYLGILLASLYGFIIRIFIFAKDNPFGKIYDYYNIYTVTFLWVLPIIISIIPFLFAKEEILESKKKQFFFPFFSVLLFFVFTLITRIEDLLCILIISFPFLISAGLVGLIIAPLIKGKDTKKLYTIVLIPFIFSPIETLIPNEREVFKVQSKIIIERDKQTIWNNIIEVPEIKDYEYNKGFYNYIGIPRPVKSELISIKGKEYRVGHFTDGLKLYETITESKYLNYVRFKIHLSDSKLRDLPTDKHILNSNNFSFENISYKLRMISNQRTELTLSCEYILNSKMNGYANFWANSIIKDFETRLLSSLKLKIEKQFPK